MKELVLLLLVSVYAAAAAAVVVNDAVQDEMDYKAKLLELSERILTEPKLRQEWDENVRAAKRDTLQPIPVFDCEVVTSKSKPDNVNELRPGDIDVIVSYGDSITAGNGLGAEVLLEVAIENRGESWSIGGDKSLDEGVITIPNVLRKFNPHVKGAASCYSVEQEYRYAWMNRAKPGGKSNHVVSQTNDIITRLRDDPRIDFDNDWKLITIFFGGNDLCQVCERPDRYLPEFYRRAIEDGIVILKEQVPRVLVNIVTMFDVSAVKNYTSGIACDLLHWGFCMCAMHPNETAVYNLREIQLGYYDELKTMIDSGKYEADDFSVVLQPHQRDLPLPVDENGDPDLTWLSPDCFHPSRKAHQGMAYSAWNSMLLPVGQKPCAPPLEVAPKYLCPSQEHPYIFTNLNSVGTTFQSPYPGPYC